MNPPDPAARAAELLRVLAHPARLLIVRLLLRGDTAVAAIEAELGIHQPALSQHLGALRAAGLLSARRASRSMIYGFADAETRRVCAAVLAAVETEATPASRPRPEPAHPATTRPRSRG